MMYVLFVIVSMGVVSVPPSMVATDFGALSSCEAARDKMVASLSKIGSRPNVVAFCTEKDGSE